MSRLYRNHVFLTSVRANHASRANDGVLTPIHIRNLGKWLLNRKPRSIITGERIKIEIPYYSYLPIHLGDLMKIYKCVEGYSRVIRERNVNLYDDYLSEIMQEISTFVVRMCEDDRVRRYVYEFYDEDVNDEDIDPDFVWEFPYDIRGHKREKELIRGFDRLIDEIGYSNILGNTGEQDIAFESRFQH